MGEIRVLGEIGEMSGSAFEAEDADDDCEGEEYGLEMRLETMSKGGKGCSGCCGEGNIPKSATCTSHRHPRLRCYSVL